MKYILGVTVAIIIGLSVLLVNPQLLKKKPDNFQCDSVEVVSGLNDLMEENKKEFPFTQNVVSSVFFDAALLDGKGGLAPDKNYSILDLINFEINNPLPTKVEDEIQKISCKANISWTYKTMSQETVLEYDIQKTKEEGIYITITNET